MTSRAVVLMLARATIASLSNLRARVPRIPLGRAVSLAVKMLTSLRATPGVAFSTNRLTVL